MALTVAINGDTSGLDRAMRKASGNVKRFDDTMGRLVKVAAVGAVVAGVGIAMFELAKAAAADRAEAQKLDRVFRRATRGIKGYNDEIERAIERGMDLAFSDSETRASLQILVQATKDADRAFRGNSIAMDIARNSGVSLEIASKAVAKAMQGNDSALKKLIPGLKEGATAHGTLKNAIRLTRGEAEEFGRTTEGSLQRISIRISELGETVGAGMLPFLDEGIPKVEKLVKAVTDLVENEPKEGEGEFFLVTLAKAIAFGSLDLATEAIIALDGALDDLSTGLAPVGEALQPVLDGIAGFGRDAGEFIAPGVDAIAQAFDDLGVKLGPLATGLDLIILPWTTLWNSMSGVLAVALSIKDEFDKLMAKFAAGDISPITAAFGLFGDVLGAVVGFLADIAGHVLRLILFVLPIAKPIIDAFAKAWGLVEDAIDGIAGFLRGIEQAAKNAMAAIDDLIARIGELGDTNRTGNGAFWDLITSELPEPEGRAMERSVGPSQQSASMTPGSIPRGGVQINIMGDPMTIERTVVRSLRTYGRRNGGRLDFALPGVLP